MPRRLVVSGLLLAAWTAVASAQEAAPDAPDTAAPELAGAEPAAGDTGIEPPALHDPLPFGHDRHSGAFRNAHISCIDCHPVGLAQTSEDKLVSPVESLAVPTSTCHGCHRGVYTRAPRQAAGTCATCHSEVGELIPPSHVEGWLHDHALEARAWTATCNDCHDAGTCFACHDERGPLSETPHPPGFRTLHGIDARLDPRSCATCHTGETCLSCHTEGSFPW